MKGFNVLFIAVKGFNVFIAVKGFNVFIAVKGFYVLLIAVNRFIVPF